MRRSNERQTSQRLEFAKLMQILLCKNCVCLVLYVIFRISSSGRLYAEGVRRAVHLYSVGLGWSARGSNVPVWVRGQGHGLGEGGRVLSLSHHGIARLTPPSLSATWLAGPRRLLATAHCRPAARPGGPGHHWDGNGCDGARSSRELAHTCARRRDVPGPRRAPCRPRCRMYLEPLTDD